MSLGFHPGNLGTLGSFAGIDVQHSTRVPQGDVLHLRTGRPTVIVGIAPLTEHDELMLRARHTGRMIVRRGMAAVLEQLGEDVEPESLFDGLFPVRGQRWDGERFVWPDELGHACGHVEVRAGCGGCDPGAIEWVLDDGAATWVRAAPARPRPTDWPDPQAEWLWVGGPKAPRG